jgi:hypothetical protein
MEFQRGKRPLRHRPRGIAEKPGSLADAALRQLFRHQERKHLQTRETVKRRSGLWLTAFFRALLRRLPDLGGEGEALVGKEVATAKLTAGTT